MLDEKEIHYINFYDTYKNGYNSTKGGEGGTTWIMPEEIKEQYRQRMYGYKHSEETKKKISESNKGRKWNEEAKKKLSEKLKGKKGPSISDEAKKKLSEMRKGVPRSKEIIEKMIETKSKKYNSQNHTTAKSFIFTSPSGTEYVITGGFKQFCEDHEISHWGMRNVIKTGKSVPSCKNWSVKKND